MQILPTDYEILKACQRELQNNLSSETLIGNTVKSHNINNSKKIDLFNSYFSGNNQRSHNIINQTFG